MRTTFTKNLNPKGIRRVSIIVNGQPVLERLLAPTYTHSDLEHYSKFKALHQSKESQYETERFNDSKLVAAVMTLGLYDWDRIATLWFKNEKSVEELMARWEKIQNFVPKEALPQKHSFLDTVENSKHSHENFMNYIRTLSQKRLNEMEALEEQRLFGKVSRSIQEKELIHRAYLVGFNHFRDVLKLNAPEEKDIGGASISFASVMETMSHIDVHDIDQSIRLMTNKIMNSSKGITRLPSEQVLSPMRDSCASTMIENDWNCFDHGRNVNMCRQTIDFHSSVLIHILPLIEKARHSFLLAASIQKEKLKSDEERVEEELLKDLSSPPMKDLQIGISVSQSRRISPFMFPIA